MLKLSNLILVVLIGVSIKIKAQPASNDYGHSSSLLFPINPGIPNTLSGSMGELRSSHFHTGIDIRTGGQEGLPVLAADDGYISRVKVKPSGYGNAIYIKHPNGHTTVYGHLKAFNGEIAAYVRKKQYERKTFSIDLYTDKNLFQVSRGDTIAVSGNSGSSGGPHVHFDVRNRNQDLLNPLHYGFKEITDTRAPLAKELALVTFNGKSRVNGTLGRTVIPIESNGNNFFIKDTINALGRIGLELFAYDRMNGTRFKTGINKIEMKVNNAIYYVATIESWPFAKSRQFYTYINYEALANYGSRFHKLYIDDGNKLDFYSNTTDGGYLSIVKDKTYNVLIALSDTYGNESILQFHIKGSDKSKNNYKNTTIPKSNWQINRNQLILKTKIEDTLLIYSKGNEIPIKPGFSKNENSIYGWDLKKAIIDSISINGVYQRLDIKAFIPTNVDYKLYDPIADIQFSKNTLFSDLFLTLSSKKDSVSGYDIVKIGNPSVPLNRNLAVFYKPTKVPIDKKYWRVYSVWGNSAAFIGGEWKGEQISFKTRSFGNYTLKADSIPPEVKPIILNKDEMVFKISDDLSGIGSLNMYINNQWVLMNYDPKKNLTWAEKPNANFSFKGELKFKVKDNIGNENIYSTEIN